MNFSFFLFVYSPFSFHHHHHCIRVPNNDKTMNNLSNQSKQQQEKTSMMLTKATATRNRSNGKMCCFLWISALHHCEMKVSSVKF